MNKGAGKGHTDGSKETPITKVTILSLPPEADPAEVLRAGGGSRSGSAVLVAGPDAAAVGELVGALRAAGTAAAGWVGDASDPAVREMALELFPGCEVVAADAG